MGDVIQTLESEKMSLDIQDVYGNTLLHWAAYRGNIELVSYLVNRGAAVSIPNTKESHTPLHWASLQGEIEICNTLIEQKAPINAVDANGHTPIFFAADNNRAVVVHMLIHCGADVRIADQKGRTPLHMAAAKGFASVVALLVAAGALIDAQDEEGKTPLYVAAKYDRTEVVEDLLRDAAANLDIKAYDNSTIFESASENVQKFLRVALKRPHDFFKREGHTTNKIIRTVAFGFIMHFLAIGFLSTLGWISAIVACVAFGFIMYGYLGWPARDERNFFFCGLAFITYATMIYHSIFVIDAGDSTTMWFFARIGEIGLFLSYWILLIKYKDPGIIPTNPVSDFQILSGKDIKKSGTVINVCAPCQQRRPLRSKHVRQTGDCVAKFDHYCDWIGNAVGEKNHKPFMCFLFFVVVHCVCYSYLAWHSLNLFIFFIYFFYFFIFLFFLFFYFYFLFFFSYFHSHFFLFFYCTPLRGCARPV